jgi:hypothetical protein
MMSVKNAYLAKFTLDDTQARGAGNVSEIPMMKHNLTGKPALKDGYRRFR